MTLPSFFIVGAPKAGTTSLYSYLAQHPEVFMCPVKEPNFFSYEEIKSQNLYYDANGVCDLKDYQGLFIDGKGKKAIGESSVSYLFYSGTPSKIKHLIPDARIIVLLRDPVQRGFSHYLMDYRLGYVDLPFEDIVYKRVKHPLLGLYYQQYVELGLYYNQVKRYLDLWEASHVKVIFTADLNSNLRLVLQELCQFLEIDHSFSFNITERYNAYEMPKTEFVSALYALPKVRRFLKTMTPEFFRKMLKEQLFFQGQKPRLSKDVTDYLRVLYKDDLKSLEGLLHVELCDWYGA